MRKGVILAGGRGTRLLPATRVMNKHMVPILNNPMIVYPIETLKKLGITDILIVSGGDHIGDFAEFLGDGSEYGVTLTYKVQKDAGGIAQALGEAKDFFGSSTVVAILGDNIFDERVTEGMRISEKMMEPIIPWFAYNFVKEVDNASRFGVYMDGKIIEKPKNVKRGMAVTGLYIYPHTVFDVIKNLKPSARGELEITDVNNYYIEQGKFKAIPIPGFWSDAGTPESLAAVTKWALDTHPPQV